MHEKAAHRHDAFALTAHIFHSLIRQQRAKSLTGKRRYYFRVHDHAYLIEYVIVDEADQTAIIYPFVALEGRFFRFGGVLHGVRINQLLGPHLGFMQYVPAVAIEQIVFRSRQIARQPYRQLHSRVVADYANHVLRRCGALFQYQSLGRCLLC